jgi:hypothetical protein
MVEEAEEMAEAGEEEGSRHCRKRGNSSTQKFVSIAVRSITSIIVTETRTTKDLCGVARSAERETTSMTIAIEQMREPTTYTIITSRYGMDCHRFGKVMICDLLLVFTARKHGR